MQYLQENHTYHPPSVIWKVIDYTVGPILLFVTTFNLVISHYYHIWLPMYAIPGVNCILRHMNLPYKQQSFVMAILLGHHMVYYLGLWTVIKLSDIFSWNQGRFEETRSISGITFLVLWLLMAALFNIVKPMWAKFITVVLWVIATALLCIYMSCFTDELTSDTCEHMGIHVLTSAVN